MRLEGAFREMPFPPRGFTNRETHCMILLAFFLSTTDSRT
jgi:hypothetical protein